MKTTYIIHSYYMYLYSVHYIPNKAKKSQHIETLILAPYTNRVEGGHGKENFAISTNRVLKKFVLNPCLLFSWRYANKKMGDNVRTYQLTH